MLILTCVVIGWLIGLLQCFAFDEGFEDGAAIICFTGVFGTIVVVCYFLWAGFHALGVL